MSDLIKRVKADIDSRGLFEGASKAICALSGGADSVCLFDILYKLKDVYGYRLECVHVNHSLRGAESDNDAEFVKQLCDRYGVYLHYKKIDVKALAKKNSIEDAARNARYGFFSTLIDDSTVIATAHTLNDNVETFFINLCRGSGLRGLCSIPVSRPGYVRPLLNVSRQDILCYLERNQLSFINDSSNEDIKYLRNFIRHKILPEFESRSDIDIYKSVAKAIDNINTEYASLVCAAQIADDSSTKSLKSLSDGILFRVVSNKLEREQGVHLDKNHFNSIKQMIASVDNKKIQIKGNLYAYVRYGQFGFERLDKRDNSVIKLSEGENFAFGKTISILTKNQGEINTHFTSCLIDCDKINSNLFVRHRKDGDKFNSCKRNSSNRLKKLLINDKIAVALRDQLIVICDENDSVVYVEGYGVDRRFKIDEHTKKAYMIDIKCRLGE